MQLQTQLRRRFQESLPILFIFYIAASSSFGYFLYKREKAGREWKFPFTISH